MNSASHGIGPMVISSIIATVSQFQDVERLILYGSRARGDFRQGSDIDMAVDAPNMDEKVFAQLWNAIDDLPIIYSMDLVQLQMLENQQLLAQIESEGRVLWQR